MVVYSCDYYGWRQLFGGDSNLLRFSWFDRSCKVTIRYSSWKGWSQLIISYPSAFTNQNRQRRWRCYCWTSLQDSRAELAFGWICLFEHWIWSQLWGISNASFAGSCFLSCFGELGENSKNELELHLESVSPWLHRFGVGPQHSSYFLERRVEFTLYHLFSFFFIHCLYIGVSIVVSQRPSLHSHSTLAFWVKSSAD